MSSNYPIDMQAAKNTKLFKKFMENKNKSIVVNGPKIQNIQINTKPQVKNQTSYVKPQPSFTRPATRSIHEVSLSPKFSQKFNEELSQNFRTTVIKNQQPFKRGLQISNPPKVYGQYSNISQQYSSQRRNQHKSIEKPIQTLQRDDGENSRKYEKILQEYNQLKQKVSQQRKQNKKQMIKMQQQIDMFEKKIFQLRNKQDELILQNKRLKQKSVSQSKLKQQIQDSNRQLTYQVQQLKDMLDGQENSSKKRQDQASHWKKITDDLKQRIKELELQISKLKDLNNMMQRQKYVAEKEVSNKQLHLNDMREKINSLITQNGVLRDEIFHITSKLYHFQQQNKSLKADLRRHSEDFPMAYLQQQLQQVPRRQQQNFSQYQNSGQKSKTQQYPQIMQKKTQRRRGQFARQRGAKRIQNLQTNEQKTPVQQNLINERPPPQMNTQNAAQQKDVAQAIRKLQQLNEQLQKLKDMKAMNGALRRQKINTQRQIQQIQQFLKTRQ